MPIPRKRANRLAESLSTRSESIFEGVDADVLARLLVRGTPFARNDGEQLLSLGKHDSFVYVLEQGTFVVEPPLRVLRQLDAPYETNLTGAVLDRAPSATVWVRGPSKGVRLKGEVVEAFLLKHPKLMERCWGRLADYLQDADEALESTETEGVLRVAWVLVLANKIAAQPGNVRLWHWSTIDIARFARADPSTVLRALNRLEDLRMNVPRGVRTTSHLGADVGVRRLAALPNATFLRLLPKQGGFIRRPRKSRLEIPDWEAFERFTRALIASWRLHRPQTRTGSSTGLGAPDNRSSD